MRPNTKIPSLCNSCPSTYTNSSHFQKPDDPGQLSPLPQECAFDQSIGHEGWHALLNEPKTTHHHSLDKRLTRSPFPAAQPIYGRGKNGFLFGLYR
ncbi:hypothetical protein JTE90_025989 [Oedothorax gibbosus]|uniref:Uncharacterized protein n=1 Tax=Oedothorax gibbosus TaxID=931172 RepID=A0AAV6TTC1_9ARAC|nr:hypothetical protein JTE90_025989 [Oedothorax gibbosus]